MKSRTESIIDLASSRAVANGGGTGGAPQDDDAVSPLVAVSRELTEARRDLDDLTAQRDEYKRLYLKTLEICKKLENGILAQHRAERMRSSEYQTSLALLGTLLGKEQVFPSPPAESDEPQAKPEVEKPPRKPPTGRKPNPDSLPRIRIEILPPEVERLGRDAFVQIGVETSTVIERRSASHVVVEIVRPKLVLKGRDRAAETTVHVQPPPELPIERGKAGPGLLADTIVRRWQDHLPLHRLQSIYAREGIDLNRSTICTWHRTLADLLRPLRDAMWADAFRAPYLCIDATGVLVQAPKRCKNGHFWVVVAPGRHVLFAYSDRHDSDAVDRLLVGYRGKIVADAHSVYDHLFAAGDCTECGCWSHARRYFFQSLGSDPERAEMALAWIRALFQIEREIESAPAAKKRRVRQLRSKPLVEAYLQWCERERELAVDGSPIHAALRYSDNQADALRAYLDDGRIPMTNNISERALRRHALGRKNWIFLGTPEAGEVNALFTTLLASCVLHEIEPWAYLRDLLCILPGWPANRVLELAPAYWKQTLENTDAQQRLDANIFRRVSLGDIREHRDTE